jgi:glycosyltransferase involved in cell wall biosynthesis
VEAIVILAKDADLRAQMGIAARANVLEKFSWASIAKHLLEICTRILINEYG